MKRIVSLILAMTMLFTCFSISFAADTANISTSGATSGKCGKNVTWSYKNGTLTISGTGAMKNYDNMNNMSEWWRADANIQRVIINNGVTSIGSYAFLYCWQLKTVTIPSSVTSISSTAFQQCESLTEINVNKSNKKYCSADGVLYNKKKTTLVCYPAGKKGASFEIPQSVTRIGNYAFCDCSYPEATNHLKRITIPAKTSYIGRYAFAGCNGISKIIFKGKLPKIEKNAFEIEGPSYPYDCSTQPQTQSIYFPTSWTYLPTTFYGTSIIKYILDSKTSLTGLSLSRGTKKQVRLNWKKVSGVSGYEVQMSKSEYFSSFTKKQVKGTSAIFSVSKGKRYYFRVRLYKTIGGKKYYSKWSSVKRKTI